MSAKSVIEIWLSGGPSSLETFDPKPDAPADYNNGLKAIDTNVPGVRLHEWWPELAKCADLFSLVRTMTHPHNGHETATYLMQTGRNPGGSEVYPAIGTVISMIRSKDYRGDLPPSVILTAAKGRFSETGFLGEKYAPLVTGGNPNQKQFIVDGIVPPGGLTKAESDRRFELLDLVDRFGRTPDFADFDSAGQTARHIVEGDAAKTFNLALEPDETRNRYGRTWLGQSLLAARRLVEYGVPYVTVNVSGWDTHKRHFETIRQRSAETDRAVAALLADLRDRKLLDSTLVWMSGEFGRTTKIDRNPPWNGGRGHYAKCFCALVAGGGFKGGQVVGESDATASNVVNRPVTPVDFLGSVYELCGINPDGPMPNHSGKKVTILPAQSKAGRLREIYRTLSLAVAAAASVLTLNAADPYVGYIYPSGIRAGTTNRLVIGGQALGGVRMGTVSGSGVHVNGVEPVPGFPPANGEQRNYLISWLKAIAKGNREQPPYPEKAHIDEWRSNSWWRVLGELDDLKLSIVELDLHTKRNALQMTPSLRQQLIVTVVADPDAEPGVRELRLFGPNGMSPPRPLVVTAEPHVAEPLFAAPFRPQPEPPLVSSFPATLDGQILPGQTDTWKLRLTAYRPITLHAVAREFQPFIGDAVPGYFNPVLVLRDPDGREVAFADDYFYHPDPVLDYLPARDGVYTLEIRDALYRGRADFVYSISAAEDVSCPDVRDIPLWRKPPCDSPRSRLIAEIRGSVTSRRKADVHVLDIPEAGDYVFDLLARRDGSPLDAKLAIRDSKRKLLATFSDTTNAVHCGSIIQGECDPVGRLHLTTGKHFLAVSDEAGKCGKQWSYVLRVHRPAPRAEVWMSPSSFALRPNGRHPAKVTVIRHDGFDKALRLNSNGPLEFRPNVIPAGTNTITVSVISAAKARQPPQAVEITATAANGKPQTVFPVIPCDEYNQAFAWDHLLPARSFILAPLGGNKKR